MELTEQAACAAFHRAFIYLWFLLHQIRPSRVSESAPQDIEALLLIPIALIQVHKGAWGYCIQRKIFTFQGIGGYF